MPRPAPPSSQGRETIRASGSILTAASVGFGGGDIDLRGKSAANHDLLHHGAVGHDLPPWSGASARRAVRGRATVRTGYCTEHQPLTRAGVDRALAGGVSRRSGILCGINRSRPPFDRVQADGLRSGAARGFISTSELITRSKPTTAEPVLDRCDHELDHSPRAARHLGAGLPLPQRSQNRLRGRSAFALRGPRFAPPSPRPRGRSTAAHPCPDLSSMAAAFKRPEFPP